MIVVVEAPTNLGLRPPVAGAVPGTGKAPDALREAGLQGRLAAAGAGFAGVVLPGRYLDDGDPAAHRLRNQAAIVDHARRLADRLGTVLDTGGTPLVLGGDCSLLVGAGLALARRGATALVHVDGHTDFRHPGSSIACASLAGEDLAAAVGRHWPAVADIDGLGPYLAPGRVAHIGCRDDDDELDEVRRSGCTSTSTCSTRPSCRPSTAPTRADCHPSS
jgi:arginase